MTTADRPERMRGFTLIELMITITVLALLASIALPTYMNQIRKARRTEAKTAVLDLAGREERLYSVTNAYSQVPADLGYGAGTFPKSVGNGYFDVDVTATATTFTITATASTPDQLDDTACKTFTILHTGVRSAQDSGSADNTAVCWR